MTNILWIIGKARGLQKKKKKKQKKIYFCLTDYVKAFDYMDQKHWKIL